MSISESTINKDGGIKQWGDLFGDDWSLAPNSTFSDLPNTETNDLVTLLGLDPLDNGDSDRSAEPMHNITAQIDVASCPQTAKAALKPTAVKTQPNLYEALKRAQMMPHAMMAMNPYGMMPDPAMMGMEWVGSPILGPNGAGGLFPTSPPMMNNQMMFLPVSRFKRPRISPYMSASEAPSPFPGSPTGFGMWPMRTPITKPVKVALSPVQKGGDSRACHYGEQNQGKCMPLFLPTLPPETNRTNAAGSKGDSNTILMTGGPEIKSPKGGNSLQEKIQETLRSFLSCTRNLEWENITVAELKRILRRYDLNATGKKADLINRITNIRNDYRHLDEELTAAGEDRDDGTATGNDIANRLGENIEKQVEGSSDNMSSISGDTLDGGHNSIYSFKGQPLKDSLENLFNFGTNSLLNLC